jgi:hypothetical protein
MSRTDVRPRPAAGLEELALLKFSSSLELSLFLCWVGRTGWV